MEKGREDMRRLLLFGLAVLAIVLIIDPAYCGITNTDIKNASKTWTGTIQDWTPMAIGGGRDVFHE